MFKKFLIWKFHNIGVSWNQLERSYWKNASTLNGRTIQDVKDTTFSTLLKLGLLMKSIRVRGWPVGQIHQQSILISKVVLDTRIHSCVVYGCFHIVSALLDSWNRDYKIYKAWRLLSDPLQNVYWLLLYTIGTVLFTISSRYFHTIIKWLTFLWVHKSLSGSFLHLKCCFSFCSYLKSICSSRYDSIEVFSSKVSSNSLWPYGL